MESLEPARLRDLPALALVNGLAMAEAPVMAKIQSPALRSVLVWALAITGWWFWLVLIALKRRHTWRLGHRALVQIVPPGQTSRIVPRDAGRPYSPPS